MLKIREKILRKMLLGFFQVMILTQAAARPVFGGEIQASLEASGYRLSPGTLYPVLHTLESSKLLTSKHRVVGGKTRKYYTITPQGNEALAEARLMAQTLCKNLGNTGA